MARRPFRQGRIDRELKTPKTQGRDLNTYSEDVGGGTPLWGRYSARLFRPESELCQTITAERPAIKVPIMSGGLQELEHVYMKGPVFSKAVHWHSPAAIYQGFVESLRTP